MVTYCRTQSTEVAKTVSMSIAANVTQPEPLAWQIAETPERNAGRVVDGQDSPVKRVIPNAVEASTPAPTLVASLNVWSKFMMLFSAHPVVRTMYLKCWLLGIWSVESLPAAD